MYDIIIIGCGITGAAVAYELSRYKLNILILEKENDVAKGSTRANSAIIHAGFDPEEGTLMAKLNVSGARMAETLCRNLDVPYIKNGALVLAFNESEKQGLEILYNRGIKNGVKNLRILEQSEIKEIEPFVSDDVISALYAPDSAICSPWEYCLALAETAVRNGAELKLNSKVDRIERKCDGWQVSAENETFESKYVINASGTDAGLIHDLALEHAFEILPTKGQYYLLDKSEGHRVQSTIFRCPGAEGKGVLVSPTVHGNLIVGPDSIQTDEPDTSTTREGLEFVKDKAIKSVPAIDFSESIRNFAGCRARTSRGDFIIEENDGFIDVAGICSPGLSAAPAIGKYVADLIRSTGFFLNEKENFINKRSKIRFRELGENERMKLAAENPAYGRIICRCETITEGEMLDAFDSPIPPISIDGVKRRVGSGMGRCQGGFCSPLVLELLAKMQSVSKDKIVKDSKESFVLYEEGNLDV